jgi:NAD(P)-dependent dehydrogenase (short-subunit alcohol dehydrogenase family)
MKEFRDRVAVVTGAASGIGRGLAERFAAEGMKVVLADVEQKALDQADAEMRERGATVLPVRTDVSKPEEMEQLAQKTLDAFGAVHVLCNNAGVSPPVGPTWERSLADWQWVVGVNMWGVIYGVHVFLPIMLNQGDEGHIVNTASGAGLISGPGISIYGMTKHAVVALSESIFHELKADDSKVGISVLCPGFVNTNIADSDRNRPDELKNKTQAAGPSDPMEQMRRQMLALGMSPAEVADKVFEAVRDDKFYILPSPEIKPVVSARLTDIVEERQPSPSPSALVFRAQTRGG